MQSSRRWTGAAAAAAGLTAAIAVVAMAARESLARSTPVNAASATAPVTALLMLFVGAGIVALAGLAMLIWQQRRRKSDDEPEPELEPLQVHWIWKLLAVLVPFALGAALVAAALLGARTTKTTPPLVVGGGFARPTTRAASRGAGTGFVVPAWLTWTVLAIVVVAIAGGVLLLLHRSRPSADQTSEGEAARAAVQAAIGALDTPTDPRDAVIAAYVAMQGTLAAHGVARSPAEAPREYLRRVLVANSATEREATTLTGLFEEARFSEHPIPERLRGIALAALRSLRTRLQTGGAT
jgi:hypothetical protein